MKKSAARTALYIDLDSHAFLTLVLAGFFYSYTGRLLWPLLCVVGGILIDTDHLIDYFLYYGRRFELSKFMYQGTLNTSKGYVLLHSWELVVFFWCISPAVPWAVPVAAGMTGHLVIDQLGRGKSRFFYFLLYRWWHRFEYKDLSNELNITEANMGLKNIDKLPENVQRVIAPYLEKLLELLKDGVVSVFAYGSVTGPEYDRKRSDINIAVVLKDASAENLKPVLRTVRGGLKKNITVPLFLTPSYIGMSMDTFPIEFMEMKDTRCVLFGEDILEDINTGKEDIRRECEYQIKGKLLALRQVYLEQALKPHALEKLIKRSLRSLFPVFRNILRIKNGKTPSPERAEVLCELSEEFGIDIAPFLDVLNDDRSDGRIGKRSAEKFIDMFITQLERLSAAVDCM